MDDTVPEDILARLREARLLGENPHFQRLTGGVASDIWLVRSTDKALVVKRALNKLRVAADWRVPVSRNASEAIWLRHAAAAVPTAAPLILLHDSRSGFIAMEFLDPASHPVWKTQLRDGIVDPAFAARVGDRLARIHLSSAGHTNIAATVNDDALFRAIRLEPYLEFTAVRHPDIAKHLSNQVTQTLTNKWALVHGDVSPKNILAGPSGPVFLDAECAWFGDPAFDLAFCLNHLLLKCLWTPASTPDLLTSFDSLAAAYMSHVKWEPPENLETRAAGLLPALLLARIDGKSPIEYLTEDRQKDFVRSFAIRAIRSPISNLVTVRDSWQHALREQS
jgi:aminoglycoside phosphotransferase (APT) family kinase protein